LSASLSLNAGVPLDVVQKLGNWKNGTMVARYAHRADAHVRDAEDTLAEILEHTTDTSRRERQKPRTKKATL